jgi:hypothetical protein
MRGPRQGILEGEGATVSRNLGGYFIVGIRPVRVIDHGDQPPEILAFDWKTGELVPDGSYLFKIFTGRGDDVDEVTRGEFDRQVKALRKSLFGRVW